MSTVGIIAEFNPLHSGHKYLINEAKKHGTVVCVISGNFVQRGDTAIAEKRIRAEAALRCGAALVLELPVCWSMSTAQNFALGGVSILKNIGCDSIVFGSECGDLSKLQKASAILKSSEFEDEVSKKLKTGVTFATAREAAASVCGLEDGILKGANNNLAIEYIGAAESLNAPIKFMSIKRKGTLHDSKDATEEFASASLIREKILKGDENFIKQYIPTEILDLFLNRNISDIRNIESGILAILRMKSAEDFSHLPDLSEGLHNKVFSSVKVAITLEQLYNMIKVKRYTHARIRRLILSAALNIDNSFFMKEPPYIRVLGFNKSGEELLKNNISLSPVPVILRASEVKKLDQQSRKLFECECRATDLFSLSLTNPQPCGLEYTSKLIKTEC